MIRRLIQRLRGARKPPANLPDSPEDWLPGDLAECVGPGEWKDIKTGEVTAGPELGQVLMVTRVWQLRGVQVLCFARFPTLRFHAAAFVKIQPRADEATAADADFIHTLTPTRHPAG